MKQQPVARLFSTVRWLMHVASGNARLRLRADIGDPVRSLLLASSERIVLIALYQQFPLALISQQVSSVVGRGLCQYREALAAEQFASLHRQRVVAPKHHAHRAEYVVLFGLCRLVWITDRAGV